MIVTYGADPILGAGNFDWMYDMKGSCKMSPTTAGYILTMRERCENALTNSTDQEFRAYITEKMGWMNSTSGEVDTEAMLAYLIAEMTRDVLPPIIGYDSTAVAALSSAIQGCFSSSRVSNFLIDDIFECAINKCKPIYKQGTNEKDVCAKGTSGCDPSGPCTKTIGGFQCSCLDGFEWDGSTCVDIDECSGANDCDGEADCTNTVGSYLCTCVNGYQGNGFNCCGYADFNCDNGECTDPDYINDDDDDCGDGSDEGIVGCVKNHQFQCDNGECIHAGDVNDGYDDCDDGSDEGVTDCYSDGQPLWQCDNGNCIFFRYINDNDDDCGDGSDEDRVDCGDNDDLFWCAEIEWCIYKDWINDFDNDCGDMSDEAVWA